jgi:hypothetical protein
MHDKNDICIQNFDQKKVMRRDHLHDLVEDGAGYEGVDSFKLAQYCVMC